MQRLKVPKLWRKVFNLPLSALLGKGPPKLCWVWTYHTSSTACISYLGRTKSYFKVALSHSKASFKKKSKSTIKQKKSPKSPQKCIVWQSKPQNSLNIYTSNFVDWLQEPLGGRKTIFKLLCLTRIWVLRKNQRALSNREKLQKQFDSGCAAWQNTPQNLLKVNIPNFVDWLQEIIGKNQKLFRSYSF